MPFAGNPPTGFRQGPKDDREKGRGRCTEWDIRAGARAVTTPRLLFRELDPVVLLHDVPSVGLRAGDLGAIVQVYAPDSVEVEFVTASGHTLALETLPTRSIRAVRDDDLLAVRPAAVRGAAW